MRARLGFATLAAALVLPVTAAPAQATDTTVTSQRTADAGPVHLYNDVMTASGEGCDYDHEATKSEVALRRVTEPGPLGTGHARVTPSVGRVMSGLTTDPVALNGAATAFSADVKLTRIAGTAPLTVVVDVFVEHADSFAIGSLLAHPTEGAWTRLGTDSALDWVVFDDNGVHEPGQMNLAGYLAAHPASGTLDVDLYTGDGACTGDRVRFDLDRVVVSGAAGTTIVDYEPLPRCDGKDITVDFQVGDVPSEGNDVVLGTESADTIDSAAGNDSVCALGGNDVITTGDGTNTVLDGPGDDTVTAGPTNDKVVNGPGNDKVNMGGGNDHYTDGPGNDTVSAVDYLTASYAAATTGITDTTTSTSDVVAGASSGTDTYTDLNWLTGSPFNDRFVGHRQTLTRDGAGGSDTIDFSSGTGPLKLDLRNPLAYWAGDAYGVIDVRNIENVIGTRYNDHLSGTEAANVLDGGPGHDQLEGFGGVNRLVGGAGFDLIRVDRGTNTVVGGDAVDKLDFGRVPAGVRVSLATTAAQTSVSTAVGSLTVVGIEDVVGTPFADTITGNAAANWLVGSGGNDTIQGMGGRDLLQAGPGIDTVSFLGATAAVRASLAASGYQNTGSSTGYDSLGSFERILGSNYADVLTGNGGANHLDGRSGSDTCHGGAGSDTKASCERFTGFP